MAPKYLRLETRRWFRNVADDWLGLEAHHIRLLVLACQAWDRGELARETLATEGLTVKNRFGEPKAHPAAGIARDATIAFARLLRELDLDVDPPVAESRPPALRSIAR
ncbi:MAG TPA: P27 family phage terminase small subunit [Vicinamibacterales bacterium]|nr:P27 family phage terminase small subunit [Vicinamibacterales bacterium]